MSLQFRVTGAARLDSCAKLYIVPPNRISPEEIRLTVQLVSFPICNSAPICSVAVRVPKAPVGQILRKRKGLTVLRKISFALVTVVLFLGMSSAAFGQKTTVVRVVVVKTDNPAAYAQAIEAGKEIMKKAGVSANTRVYQASYAGPNAGSVVASIEYPSMAALADAEMKLRANKDYIEWIKGLDKIRTIVSDSIYREL
jgi:hypothetical protein